MEPSSVARTLLGPCPAQSVTSAAGVGTESCFIDVTTMFVSRPSYALSEHAEGTAVRRHGQALLFRRWKLLDPMAFVIANVERRRILANLRRSFATG